MFRSLRRRLPRLGRWPRLCAAGICVTLAVSSAVSARRDATAKGSTAPVVVAVRALPAGHVLIGLDVVVRQWPARVRPGAARASPNEVVGRRLAGPIAADEAITSTRLLGRDLTTGLDDNSVAAPIAVDDAHLADLIHPGDRVSVLATPRRSEWAGTGAGTDTNSSTDVTVVVTRAVVLAVLADPGDGVGTAATEIVVAVPRETATRIARLRSSRVFAVLGDPP
jgi:Flp pilus assembly protein CpaB